MEKTDFTPKVTVSLCTYNSNNEWLHTAVESILNQTFVDFELLIIDDGSKDKPDFSADIFKDPRIEIVCKEKNEGLAASRNLAIKLSKGKY
ncbi:MAG: glycosyltransferase family 2 protein, partial [Oscillospiraceae bacterium]|nr:glycosyltransferase family 2 protein [Candidatus Equicaccousia limihippi]